MRISSNLTLAVAIGSLAFCFFLTPIRKRPTDSALAVIAERYLRKDLSADEQKGFEFEARWIRSNERAMASAFEATRLALLFVTLVVVAQVLTEKRLRKRMESVESID
ncbi:MAG: hypothetical protein KDN18_25630 [Verrucomicrobiae bacterium]|nr:hypothetical protein [Verrucomicrobiae bacterium]